MALKLLQLVTFKDRTLLGRRWDMGHIPGAVSRIVASSHKRGGILLLYATHHNLALVGRGVVSDFDSESTKKVSRYNKNNQEEKR